MSMNPELIALNKEIDLNDPEKLSISFSVRTEDGEVKSGSFDSTSLNFDAVATLVESYIDGNMERDVLGIALLSMSRPIEQVKERFRKIEGLLNGRVTTNDSTVLIDYDKIDKVRGMDICFVTTATTDEEARELLKLMGAPFSK